MQVACLRCDNPCEQLSADLPALTAGHEQLYPTEWLEQKQGVQPHLRQYHLLPTTVDVAQVMQFVWFSSPGVLVDTPSWHIGKIAVTMV